MQAAHERLSEANDVAPRPNLAAMSVPAELLAAIAEQAATDIKTIRTAINPLIDSVVRNKDAMAALVRLQRIDNYTYAH